MLNRKQLHQLWKEQPCWMFTGEEICEICNVSQHVVSRVKAMPDSPFFLNKCRPEWFLDWMRRHPEFQLTKAIEVVRKRSIVADVRSSFRDVQGFTGAKPAAKRRSARRPGTA